jgi:hypothetical protein
MHRDMSVLVILYGTYFDMGIGLFLGFFCFFLVILFPFCVLCATFWFFFDISYLIARGMKNYICGCV